VVGPCAELVGNVACRLTRLEFEADRKVLAGREDLLSGTNDVVVVIDDSDHTASEGFSRLIYLWNTLFHAIAKNQLLSQQLLDETSSLGMAQYGEVSVVAGREANR
jgi:hypothetical protein